MSATTINLHQQQTYTAASVSKTLDSPKTASLDGRSVVTCPTKTWLTDAQIKKVCIIAFPIFTSVVAPAIVGALTFASFGALPAVATAISGLAGFLALFFWPSIDYQKPENAEMIRNDLKRVNLKDLHYKYDFSDLAKYGYISKENCEKMQTLYDSRPTYDIFKPIVYHMTISGGMHHYLGGMYQSPPSLHVFPPLPHYVYEQYSREAAVSEARILNEFNKLQNSPNFLL